MATVMKYTMYEQTTNVDDAASYRWYVKGVPMGTASLNDVTKEAMK
jgi:hypothetical protein